MDYSKIIDKIKRSIAIVYLIKDGKVINKGTGFVFFRKDVLVTCNHVISKQESEILIQFSDSDFITAKVMIRDEEHDLALLKFEDGSRKPLELSKQDTIKEGMPVIFSGYPLSLDDLTTHQGILSAISKDVTGIVTYLIDGTVNSGNSGCPLMSEKGKVIGVVNAKRMEHSNLLIQLGDKPLGAVSLQGMDLTELLKAITNNVQLGIGYAIPCSYIPKPVIQETKEVKIKNG